MLSFPTRSRSDSRTHRAQVRGNEFGLDAHEADTRLDAAADCTRAASSERSEGALIILNIPKPPVVAERQINTPARPRTYLISDHDPLYRFHQWQANLRILNVKDIKTAPHVPLSHPFIERLIGTIRREYLDRVLFWTTTDLEMKLLDFQRYYNGYRAHAGLGGLTLEPRTFQDSARAGYRWRAHCRGLYHTPIAITRARRWLESSAPNFAR